ncbi:T9SS type A sorting domain-containing protein [Chryseobacterium viscerum]|uniref:T9SS type A sorting domain-containing protein n=1 Tax=Chryseobacterium viscerum TaxID=1037377 RepID=A0A5N4BVK0_9FLAO|nr:T9SS type A sorting domain-containing protein [Chryseobacterium viscerum]KAB1232479.1 T9SS type A sorting domain-containing protein [Chryseobacterium viscerum]
MKKQLLFVLTLVAQTSFAQIISKDPMFASNGIYNLPAGSSYLGELTEATNTVFYQSFDSNTNQLIISKATSYNGSLDLAFGANGKIALNYASDALVGFIRHNNDKLTLLLRRYDSANNINYLDVVRLLSNGQLDPSFSNGGIKALANFYQDNFNIKNNLIEQGNKIIVSGTGIDTNGFFDGYTHTFRLNSDGTSDNSFGSNAELLTNGIPRIILDNQFNLIFLEHNIIKKYTYDGQLMTGFGNNGVAVFNGVNVNVIKTDSGNRIIYAQLASLSPATIGRLNADGTPDTTFSYNGTLGLEFWDIYEKNNSYYIAGYADFNNAPAYYIAKLNQNGAIDQVFGEYVENDSNLLYHFMHAIKVFDNNVIVYGEGTTKEIVKYLLSGTATLSTAETLKNNTEITFESPIKQELVYHSKEKIDKIEIYSADGRLLKTVNKNNSDVSELSKGVYFAKAIFGNGKVFTKKLIKN